MNFEFVLENEEGEETSCEVPGKYEVCSRCEGHGYILSPSIAQHAYSSEEFEETFWDEEDRAQYFTRGGIYDVPCPECGTARVVCVPDFSRMTQQQKELCNKYLKYKEELQKELQEDARIYRMESGGY